MTVAAGVSSRPSSSSERNERGASAVEYGLLISGIAAMIAVVVLLFGNGILGLFQDTCTLVMTQAGKTC